MTQNTQSATASNSAAGGGAVKDKQKKEPAVPAVCVCGRTPCIVKHKSKRMVACPDSMVCSMRSRWASTEQAAIIDWNIQQESAKQEEKRAKRK